MASGIHTAVATPPPPPPPRDELEDGMSMQIAGVTNDNPIASLKQHDDFKLRFCTVCASNQNRSMVAHLQLADANFPVISFGTGSLVRLPGPSANQPNVYAFNSTSYDAIYRELEAKDARLYRANGVLGMLGRNRDVKWGPERWQDWRIGEPRPVVASAPGSSMPNDGITNSAATKDANDSGGQNSRGPARGALGVEAGIVDIVITCEERCWDAVVDDLHSRGAPLNRPVHVFNVDIRDNHEEALVGGRAILDLAQRLNDAAVEERAIYTPTEITAAESTIAEARGTVGHVAAANLATHSSGGVNMSDATSTKFSRSSATQAASVDGGRGGGSGRPRIGFDERVPDILADWQERWPNLPALWTLAWF